MNDQKTFLKLEHVSKRYGNTGALNDVSLSFPAEGIYGVFGRNGAGKSTLLDIIARHKFPDSGTVSLASANGGSGEPVCYITEKNYFPRNMKIATLLSLCSSTYEGWDGEYSRRLCAAFGVDTEKRYGELSRGTKSCVKIVIGLAAGQALTIFDEPVLGLDAAARDRFYKELVDEYARAPRLFIISTHYIDEAANLFDEAVIIEKGVVIKHGPVEDLTSRVFYVSGAAGEMKEFLEECRVYDTQSAGSITMAVVECAPEYAKRYNGLNFSRVGIQKLFVHLTNTEEQKGGSSI